MQSPHGLAACPPGQGRPRKRLALASRDVAIQAPLGRRRYAALAGAGVFTALALGLPSAAAAAASSAAFGVSAIVQPTCAIAVTSLMFGAYTGVVLANTATITVTCAYTTPYTVGFDAGLGATPRATVTTRHMMGDTAVLNYVLTQDAAHAVNWGNTPAIDTPAAAAGTGAAVALTVYGQIAAGQFVAPGPYADTVTATVNF